MHIYECNFLVKKILGTDQEDLEKILAEKEVAYIDFELPKKGGTRLINGINTNEHGKKLGNLQRKLYKNFLSKLPLASPAKGFVKGESYCSFLKPHAGSKYFMRIDIENFFGSISPQITKDILNEYVKDAEARDIIFELCMLHDKIPQGAITSPVLSNVIFSKIDQRILKYCQSVEEHYKTEQLRRKKEAGNAIICYTRYADDMLFSSSFLDFADNLYFFRMIVKILCDNGFKVNRKKTVIAQNEIVMNGYVVGRCIRLSRSKLANVKKVLYYFRDKSADEYKLDKQCFGDKKILLQNINQLKIKEHGEDKQFTDIHQLIYYLSGCRSWIISVLQAEDIPFREIKDMQKIVRRIETLLEKLQSLEE